MIFPSLPYWQDLPDLDLYLDQVLLYVNQCTDFSMVSDNKSLTASMINNYVKHGYVAKPIKKKYQKQQLARLIAISLFKTVFPIQDISRVLQKLQSEADSERLYNTFVSCWNQQIPIEEDVPQIVQVACQTVKDYHKTIYLSQEVTQ
ncbi:DUF1836 domain-containing protein [Streptococcus dysgalactiae subsp. equisimilis]|uniref:Hypothetical cytosolic protein n=1 Tax=Streptococcus dysgalactiae TaxID=1334 RepID=A0A9X9QQY3_STRDY|nr:DUF1836 domain-containing protein [Streptococcus dysgalactiae]MCL6221436.1 DUF1836 domain-containing protein [Streptococcus dysgalactiae subsp. equisimilis]UMY69008.1 DUF1836 domain-containing protein [Streptococcus dysgalactiae subsp. equisimilis]VTS31826.1 hypothetical cytosolic protein [Streptococcus dysgalactiae subsp. equisimilis]VTS32915.1 hypothetical cytosolic protein [Streptococcus dysgalactiae subsp. equisimilis]VTS83526.1 hypothetical cytosolic protein [Streptococcus dysgalactiae